MKPFTFSILIAFSLISPLKAQISAPTILYADSSATILHAGILVEKGEEYHLVSRKKNFGIIHYRMDTLFQLLEENATHVSSSVEEVFELTDGSRIVSGYFRSVDNRSAVQATKFDSTGTEVWQARSYTQRKQILGRKFLFLFLDYVDPALSVITAAWDAWFFFLCFRFLRLIGAFKSGAWNRSAWEVLAVLAACFGCDLSTWLS